MMIDDGDLKGSIVDYTDKNGIEIYLNDKVFALK